MIFSGNNYTHIVLLAAGIKQDGGGRWVSTDLTEEDNLWGAPGGRLRVAAVSILSQECKDAQIIAGGHKGFDVPEGHEERPFLSEILLQELCEHGVPVERIILETESNTTYQKLKFLEMRANDIGLGQIAIVTNRYHIPRLNAMIDAEFPSLRERIVSGIVAAEDVLIAHNPQRWEAFINDAYASEFMSLRKNMEEHGLEQILTGVYKFR